MTDPCPHCRRFREERDEAVEALAQVRRADEAEMALARVRRCAVMFRLEPMPARMLLRLLNGRPASREALCEASGSAAVLSRNAVDVRLVQVRAAARPPRRGAAQSPIARLVHRRRRLRKNPFHA